MPFGVMSTDLIGDGFYTTQIDAMFRGRLARMVILMKRLITNENDKKLFDTMKQHHILMKMIKSYLTRHNNTVS